MALLFMDSFDHYATADLNEKYATSGSTAGTGCTIGITAAVGRRTSGGLRWTTGSSTGIAASVGKTLTPADATVILGFALNVSAGSTALSGTILAQVRDSVNGIQLSVRLNQAMTLSVLRGGSGGPILGTTTATLSIGAYTYIEWKTRIHSTTGTVDLFFNGVSVLSLTGQNTQNTGLASWSTIYLGQVENVSASNSTTRNLDYDDVYVLDGTGPAPWNSVLGDCRVDVCLPTAPGATTGWTPNAGANWAAVDDAAPDDDSTFVSTAVFGATDTFVTQNTPIAGVTIFGVQHCLNLKKMDAGSCLIAPVIRHAGVDYPGASASPSTSYAYALAIAATNPGTGAAWVEADFNAAEFGYTRTG